MEFGDWIGIIGIVVAIIGIIVGVIGGASLRVESKNKAAKISGSLQQAQIINNGLDTYAVIRLSAKTAKEEMKNTVERIDQAIDEIKNRPGPIPELFLLK